MTHVKNIPHILKHGITHQNSPNKNPDYVQIGFPGLITKREKVIVLGRNKLSDYIPFYFGYRMPMLYVIKHGNNSATYNMNSISNEDVVYCITNLDQIINHGLGFAFSNGHALSAFTDFFNVEDVGNIHNIIDHEAIGVTYWKDDNDLDLKRRKEAEFLLEDDLPVSALLGYAVFNDAAKQKLIAYGIQERVIAVRPQYYF